MSNLRQRRRHNKRISRVRQLGLVGLMAVLLFPLAGNIKQRNVKEAEFTDSGYPESLIELAERNPETKSFVHNYVNHDGTADSIDISEDVEKGTIPLFLQWDERWGYETYGDDFLAITGCGPTCLSMVYCGLTGNADMNPYEMGKKAETEGYYVEGAGSSWSMMEDLAEEIGLEVHNVIFDEEHIRSEITNGRPVICIMGAGDFTKAGHFIVLTGVDEDGQIIVNDPNSKENSSKSWELEKLMRQMKNLWSYSIESSHKYNSDL